MTTLKASLLATVIATAAWWYGVTDNLSPAHPWLAVFFVTVGATALLMYVLPEHEER